MSTSGSTDWTLNRDEIIAAALRKLRAVDPRLTIETIHYTNGAIALNGMVKAWQHDGILLWVEQEIMLHYQNTGTQRYGLGTTGALCGVLTDCFATQLSADSAASDTTLDVDSDDDIDDGDYIGVELDSGAIEWSLVSGAPSGNVVTIDTGLSGAASTDNWVFTFTTKISRPLKIIEARVRDTDNVDVSLNVHTDETSFISQTDKTATGRVTDILYTPVAGNGLLRVWPVCGTGDITDRIVMTAQRTIEDFDATANNFDGPSDVLNAIIWNLALELSPEFGVNVMGGKGAAIVQQAMKYYRMMKKMYGNREPVRLQPGRGR